MPQWLWLLLGVAGLFVAYVLIQLRRRRYAVRFSTTALLGSVAPRRPGWRRHVAFGLILVALAAFTVAMGRPTVPVKVPRQRATVMLVIDVSLSMNSTDVAPTRLKAAQRAATEFAKILPAPINLGLESFAGTTSIDVIPTTNRSKFINAIGALHLAPSTATGDAIVAALAALRSFQRQLNASPNPTKQSPSRILLLSDGAPTAGQPVDTAIAAAVQAHIPISTIAFGTAQGTVNIEGNVESVPADPTTMRHIAQGTGGSFRAAASIGQLRQIYQNFNTTIGYTTHRREVTTWPVGIGLILAFAGLGLSLLWGTRLP